MGECQLLGSWPGLPWLGLENLMELLDLSTPAFSQCCAAVFTEAEDSECCHGRAADLGTDPVKEALSGMQRGTSSRRPPCSLHVVGLWGSSPGDVRRC